MESDNKLPLPKKAEPTELVQVKIKRSLVKEVDQLRKADNPKSPVTRKAIVEWGFAEWAKRAREAKKG